MDVGMHQGRGGEKRCTKKTEPLLVVINWTCDLMTPSLIREFVSVCNKTINAC